MLFLWKYSMRKTIIDDWVIVWVGGGRWLFMRIVLIHLAHLKLKLLQPLIYGEDIVENRRI